MQQVPSHEEKNLHPISFMIINQHNSVSWEENPRHKFHEKKTQEASSSPNKIGKQHVPWTKIITRQALWKNPFHDEKSKSFNKR